MVFSTGASDRRIRRQRGRSSRLSLSLDAAYHISRVSVCQWALKPLSVGRQWFKRDVERWSGVLASLLPQTAYTT
jgi:hypothetical protein